MKSYRISELNKDFNEKKKLMKSKIRLETNRKKRILLWASYALCFPWVWCWYNLRDIPTIILFLGVCLVVSIEVWLPALISLFVDDTTRKFLIGFSSTMWLFWLGPGTPFLVICISITIGLKALWNKIILKKQEIK